MESLKHMREAVMAVLNELAEPPVTHGEVEIERVFDTVRDHYQLVSVGWYGKERVYGAFVHLDIKNEKIWVQLNNTDVELGERLLEHGIDRGQIVLGFQSPERRPFTDYASG